MVVIISSVSNIPSLSSSKSILLIIPSPSKSSLGPVCANNEDENDIKNITEESYNGEIPVK
jgi:hypothetical protein